MTVEEIPDYRTRRSDVPALECVDLVQNFKVRRRGKVMTVSAVAGVSLRVERGEVMAIVGETGSGKTTLARSILRIPPPTTGRVVVGDKDVGDPRRMSGRELGRLVQMVSQDPFSALDPRWSVERLVAEPLSVRDEIPMATSRRMVAEMLELVGLPISTYGGRLTRELSGGQAQRVAIARALVGRPDVVILDEPTTALDVSIQSQILRLLVDLRKEITLTYLVIAHDLSVVRVLADRVMTMYLGRACELGDVEHIFGNPAHPYTAALLSAIPPRPRDGVSRKPIRLIGETASPLAPPSGCRFRTRCQYAQAICGEAVPPMHEVAPQHQVACHFPLGR